MLYKVCRFCSGLTLLLTAAAIDSCPKPCNFRWLNTRRRRISRSRCSRTANSNNPAASGARQVRTPSAPLPGLQGDRTCLRGLDAEHRRSFRGAASTPSVGNRGQADHDALGRGPHWSGGFRQPNSTQLHSQPSALRCIPALAPALSAVRASSLPRLCSGYNCQPSVGGAALHSKRSSAEASL